MTSDQIATILEAHGKWRRGEVGGTRAYLTGADLADANLADADLADADLTRANLARANLARAYLTGANLTDAKGINLTGHVDPSEPYTHPPDAERYAKRAARFRAAHPEVPVIPALDRKILDAVTSGGGHLDMSSWHTCDTTHCRAGWAITLGGEPGHALEMEHGPHRAGVMIYQASTGRVPHFFATDSQALEDLREQAATQTE